MPLAAVEQTRLYRQIADQLRQLIAGGEFPPGSRLPAERELAEKLGVSRPSVREALIALEVEGRVRIRVGSGVYVIEPPARPPVVPLRGDELAEGPFEVLEARALIESAVAGEAAARITPEGVAILDDVLARMAQGELGDAELIALDREFHVALAAMLGNAVVTRFVGELFDQRINPYFALLARYFENSDTWREAIAEHRAIRDAVIVKDAAGARDAMRAHLRKSQDRFSQSFGERSCASDPSAIGTDRPVRQKKQAGKASRRG